MLRRYLLLVCAVSLGCFPAVSSRPIVLRPQQLRPASPMPTQRTPPSPAEISTTTSSRFPGRRNIVMVTPTILSATAAIPALSFMDCGRSSITASGHPPVPALPDSYRIRRKCWPSCPTRDWCNMNGHARHLLRAHRQPVFWRDPQGLRLHQNSALTGQPQPRTQRKAQATSNKCSPTPTRECSADDIAVSCHNRYLSAVEFCLSKDLQPIACQAVQRLQRQLHPHSLRRSRSLAGRCEVASKSARRQSTITNAACRLHCTINSRLRSCMRLPKPHRGPKMNYLTRVTISCCFSNRQSAPSGGGEVQCGGSYFLQFFLLCPYPSVSQPLVAPMTMARTTAAVFRAARLVSAVRKDHHAACHLWTLPQLWSDCPTPLLRRPLTAREPPLPF